MRLHSNPKDREEHPMNLMASIPSDKRTPRQVHIPSRPPSRQLLILLLAQRNTKKLNDKLQMSCTGLSQLCISRLCVPFSCPVAVTLRVPEMLSDSCQLRSQGKQVEEMSRMKCSQWSKATRSSQGICRLSSIGRSEQTAVPDRSSVAL